MKRRILKNTSRGNGDNTGLDDKINLIAQERNSCSLLDEGHIDLEESIYNES